MSNPLVSILLPVFNGERHVREALDSVLSQQYSNWELVIVDDCSTDSTPDILAEYAARDERIYVYRNAQNKRLPATINEAFARSNGSYITWTSDDNILEPNALSVMVRALDGNPGIDLVYCDVVYVGEDGRELGSRCTVASPRLLYFYNTVQACFMYRRHVQEQLGGYDTDLFLVEDYDFWLRAYRSFAFLHLKGVAPYRYRFHAGSLTSQRQHDIREKACGLLKRELHSKELPISRRISAGIGFAYNYLRMLSAK